MNEYMTFGDRLKKIRTDRGLTQAAFGKIVGKPKQSISRYELGERIPQVTVVEEFADKLNIPIAYFFSEGNRVAEENDITYEVNTPELRQLVREAAGLSKKDLKSLIEQAKKMKSKKV